MKDLAVKAFTAAALGFVGLGMIGNALPSAETTKPAAQEAKPAQVAKAESTVKPLKYSPNVIAGLCADRVAPFLKDPKSIRVIGKQVTDLTNDKVTIKISYTATNGFGGRVQDVKSCTFTR